MRRVVGKIDVLGVTITVIETNVDKELRDDKGQKVAAFYAPEHCLIVLDSRYPSEAKVALRNHEIAHAVLERMGVKLSYEKEEFLVDKVFPAYVEVLAKAGHLMFKRRT